MQKHYAGTEKEHFSILLKTLLLRKMTEQKLDSLSHIAMGSLQKEKQVQILDVLTYIGLQEQLQP